MRLRDVSALTYTGWLLLRGKSGDDVLAELHDWQPPEDSIVISRVALSLCLAVIVGFGALRVTDRWLEPDTGTLVAQAPRSN